MRVLITASLIAFVGITAWAQNIQSDNPKTPTALGQPALERLLSSWGYRKSSDLNRHGFNIAIDSKDVAFLWKVSDLPFLSDVSDKCLWLHVAFEFKQPPTLYQINKINSHAGSTFKLFRRIDGSVEVNDYITLSAGVDLEALKQKVDSFAKITANPAGVFDTPKEDIWNTSTGGRPFDPPKLNLDDVINGISEQDFDMVLERMNWTYKGGGYVAHGPPNTRFTVDGVQMALYGCDDIRFATAAGSTVTLVAFINCPAEGVTTRLTDDYVRGLGVNVNVESKKDSFSLVMKHDLRRGVTIRSLLGYITDLVSHTKSFKKSAEDEYNLKHPGKLTP